MVIIQNKSGQLANRLFAFSHFIGNVLEHKYTLINPTFGEYCKYFEATRNNDFGGHPIYVSFGVQLPFLMFDLCARFAAKCIQKSCWHEYIALDSMNREFN